MADKYKPTMLLLIIIAIIHTLSAFRLPHNMKPEHYDITIITHLDDVENFTFNGTSKIQIRIDDATNRIILHSKELDVDEKTICIKSLDDRNIIVNVTNVTYDKKIDFLIIDVSASLRPRFLYELYIQFKGRLKDKLAGFYRSHYKNEDTGKTEWLAITQFEPIGARLAFPCFDEPEYKATFSINIGRKEGLTSLSNMPLIRSTPIADKKGYYLDTFEISEHMSTYLVAYMVSNFDCVQSDFNASFKIWARRDKIGQTQYASEIGPKVLNYFENYFDESYPLPKLDMIAVPDLYPPAMENWGMPTFRESELFYNSNVSTTSDKCRVTDIIAHELAHQWFGNLVTMKWWTDLWLNEGFATYASTLVVDHLYPRWNVHEKNTAYNYILVFKYDSLDTSYPLSRVETKDNNMIEQIFDAISYKKGFAVVRMLHLFLGDDAFKEGIRSYLKKFMYRNADKNDLWNSLTVTAHSNNILPQDISVKQVMDSWTIQSGYPLLTVHRNYENNSAEISQGCITEEPEYFRKKWWIPLSYITNENSSKATHSTKWLRKKSAIILDDMPSSDNWIIFNENMAGLYRVMYDEHNWELIVAALKSPSHDGIPTLNRLQLIVDSMDFAWSGRLNYSLAFSLLQYLNTEYEYLPWKYALFQLKSLHTAFRRSLHYEDFKKYLRNMITPVYDKISGFYNETSSSADSIDAALQYEQISKWACRVDVPKCKDKATELFYDWMKQDYPDDVNNIPIDLRSDVYCIGINKGGKIEWDFVWQRYLNTEASKEKHRLLLSLGCTTDLETLKKLLEWSITDKSDIIKQDAHAIFHKIGRSNAGYNSAKNFLYERISDIRKYFDYKPSMVINYIKTIASQITSQIEIDELCNWIDSNNKSVDGASVEIQKSIEFAKTRRGWRELHFESIAATLRNINL